MSRTEKPLTKSQIAVLHILHAKGPCETAKSSWGNYVNGVTAQALARRGLVIWVKGAISPRAAITDAGRAALVTFPEPSAVSKSPAAHLPSYDMRPPNLTSSVSQGDGMADLWRNDSAKKANQLHKNGRRPTVDTFKAVRLVVAGPWRRWEGRLDHYPIGGGAELTLEEAFERVRLDALANPDHTDYLIRRCGVSRETDPRDP